MELPATRLRVMPSHKGKASNHGWLQIELRGLDLEGVSHLYVDLGDVQRIRGKADEASTIVDAWDQLLGQKEG